MAQDTESEDTLRAPTVEPVTPRCALAESFTREEVRQLNRAWDAGQPIVCPRCSNTMDRRAISPRPDVSYVRERAWLVCPTCHASVVLDRRERP